MPLMTIAVAIQLVLALANLAAAIMLGRRLRRMAGLERTLQDIRQRLRENVRSPPKPAGPPQPRLDPTLGFRDPAR